MRSTSVTNLLGIGLYRYSIGKYQFSISKYQFCIGKPSCKYRFVYDTLQNAKNVAQHTESKSYAHFFVNITKGGKNYVNKVENREREFTTATQNGRRYVRNGILYPCPLQKREDYYCYYWTKGVIELRRVIGVLAYFRYTMNIDVEKIIASETERLCNKYGKSFLDCEEIVTMTGLGRDNVRVLMHNGSFPVVKVGKRQVVSILAFVTWQIQNNLKGGN